MSSLASIVEGVRGTNHESLTELYTLVNSGIRAMVYHHLGGQDIEDRVHNVWIATVRSIQAGGPDDPEKLMAFIRTIAHRQIAQSITEIVSDRSRRTVLNGDAMYATLANSSRFQESNDPDFHAFAVLRDDGPSPEASAIESEEREIAMRIIASLKPMEREVLTRALQEEPADKTCSDLNLTPTQYRLTKTRAKERFTLLASNRMQPRRRMASGSEYVAL